MKPNTCQLDMILRAGLSAGASSFVVLMQG
jgi:hypothetical protein